MTHVPTEYRTDPDLLRLIGLVHTSRIVAAEQASLYQVARNPIAYSLPPDEIDRLTALRYLATRMTPEPFDPHAAVRSPEDVYARFGRQMGEHDQEVFKVVYLNTANQVIADEDVSRGSLNATIVDSRLVFRRAIAYNAAAIVCLHNHPSGNREPSAQDIRITKELIEAGKTIGIRVNDHLVVTSGGYTSLAERGVI